MKEWREKKKNRHPVRRILHAIGLGDTLIAAESRANAIIPPEGQAAVFQPVIPPHLDELHLFSLSEDEAA